MSNVFPAPQPDPALATLDHVSPACVALLRCIKADGLERRGYRFFAYRPRIDHMLAQILTDTGLIEWRTLNSAVMHAVVTEAGQAFLA